MLLQEAITQCAVAEDKPAVYFVAFFSKRHTMSRDLSTFLATVIDFSRIHMVGCFLCICVWECTHKEKYAIKLTGRWKEWWTCQLAFVHEKQPDSRGRIY